jgi:hypothetical protein
MRKEQVTIFRHVAEMIADGKSDREIFAVYEEKHWQKIRRAINQLRPRLGQDNQPFEPSVPCVTKLALAENGQSVTRISLAKVAWLERPIVE